MVIATRAWRGRSQLSSARNSRSPAAGERQRSLGKPASGISRARTGAHPRFRWRGYRHRRSHRAGPRSQGRRCASPGSSEPCRATLDVEAVVSGADCEVARQDAVVVLPSHVKPIVATSPDLVSTNDVVNPADRRRVEPEVDAVPSSANDEIALHQVVASLLDRDAVSVSGEVVAGDHVVTAGGNDEPALFPTKRLRRTRLRSALSIEIPGPESEIRFPSITLSLEPNATCIPGWALCLNELSTTRMSCEAKMPRPSPSGAGCGFPNCRG